VLDDGVELGCLLHESIELKNQTNSNRLTGERGISEEAEGSLNISESERGLGTYSYRSRRKIVGKGQLDPQRTIDS
jgi:hypothetical protein